MTASHGARRSASAAISSCRSVFSPPAAAICASSSACSAASASKSAPFLAVGRVHLLEPLLGGERAADALFHRLAHGLVGVELRLLRQVADLQARHRRRLALDVVVDAGHDLEQGRLARAVQAEHADLGAGEERERDVLEDLPFGRNDLAHAVHREDVLSHANVRTEASDWMRKRGRGGARPALADPPIVAGPRRARRIRAGKPAALERLAMVVAVGRIAVVQARQVLADAEGRRQRQGQAALLGRGGGVAALRMACRQRGAMHHVGRADAAQRLDRLVVAPAAKQARARWFQKRSG